MEAGPSAECNAFAGHLQPLKRLGWAMWLGMAMEAENQQ
tara:strand:- start:75 stop:191 length:117 start_codon:yes stop_codon:yes gene_type:complete